MKALAIGAEVLSEGSVEESSNSSILNSNARQTVRAGKASFTHPQMKNHPTK